MLSACRTDGEVFPIPQLAVEPGEVEGFLQELRGFHAAFACFARSEPREHFLRSMVGPFSTLERRSIEPIALQVQGGTFAPCHDTSVKLCGMKRRYCRPILLWGTMILRDPAGVLIFDETRFPK
jgi:SRSO17 transposase